MPTNDGYAPYPLGLTAAIATSAIKRAANLDQELLGYVRYTISSTPPTILNTRTSDIWIHSDSNKKYSAVIAGDNITPILLWFEI